MAGVYIFIGPPGAGKGTMGDIFCEKTGVVHISTGQLLRDEMTNGTELGKKVKDIIAAGALVSDEIVAEMVKNRLAKQDILEHGCLLDGFPRTVAQADMLDKIIAESPLKMAGVLLIEADNEMLMGRLTSRRMCSNKACGAIYNIYAVPPKVEGKCDRCGADLYQRSDDTEKTVADRLRIYDEQTAPVADFYRQGGRLVTVQNAGGSIEENYARLAQALGI